MSTLIEDIESIHNRFLHSAHIKESLSNLPLTQISFYLWPHESKPRAVTRPEYELLTLFKYCNDANHPILIDLRGNYRIRICWGDHIGDETYNERFDSLEQAVNSTLNFLHRRLKQLLSNPQARQLLNEQPFF